MYRLVLALCLLVIPARAEIAGLADAQAILAQLPPQSGKFTQVSGEKRILEGTFLFDFPHRLRFAYHKGAHSVVTIRRRWIAVQDFQGGEANRFPVSATPLKLLLTDQGVRLDARYVGAIRRRADTLVVELRDPTGDIPGKLRLRLTASPPRLRGWQSVDAQGTKTTVTLHDIAVAARLPDHLFHIQEDLSDE